MRLVNYKKKKFCEFVIEGVPGEWYIIVAKYGRISGGKESKIRYKIYEFDGLAATSAISAMKKKNDLEIAKRKKGFKIIS